MSKARDGDCECPKISDHHHDDGDGEGMNQNSALVRTGYRGV